MEDANKNTPNRSENREFNVESEEDKPVKSRVKDSTVKHTQTQGAICVAGKSQTETQLRQDLPTTCEQPTNQLCI